MLKNTLLALIVITVCSFTPKQNQKRILVFSKTKGFRHGSIGAGKTMFLTLGKQQNVAVDTTEDAGFFTPEKLKQYNAVVFLNTTGDVLDSVQQIAFQNYIHNGGGYVGIHSATDTEYDWPWYNKLVGAYFDSHPAPQHAHYDVIDKNFPATKNLPDTMNRFEEIYNFKSLQKDILTFLIKVDETSYTGGNMNNFHPNTWYHKFDGGRAFYTEFGHHDETYSDPVFQQIVWKGLEWAMKK